jgi:hypothetical protein
MIMGEFKAQGEDQDFLDMITGFTGLRRVEINILTEWGR